MDWNAYYASVWLKGGDKMKGEGLRYGNGDVPKCLARPRRLF